MSAHSRPALVAVLAAAAASLHGCALTAGGPMCAEVEVNEHLKLPKSAEGVGLMPTCADGFEYKGPKLSCNWVGKECEKKHKDTCGKILGWGEDGDGLKEWPEDGKVEYVDHVPKSLLGSLKDKAKEAGSAIKKKAKEAGNTIKEKAEKAGGAIKNGAEDLKKKAEKAVKGGEEEAKKAGGDADKEVEKKEARRLAKTATLPKSISKGDSSLAKACVKKPKVEKKEDKKEEASEKEKPTTDKKEEKKEDKKEDKEEDKPKTEKKYEFSGTVWESGSYGSVFFATFGAVMAVGGVALLAFRLVNRPRNRVLPLTREDYDLQRNLDFGEGQTIE